MNLVWRRYHPSAVSALGIPVTTGDKLSAKSWGILQLALLRRIARIAFIYAAYRVF